MTADLPKDDSSNDVLLSATKLYIVIGCIVALVLVAIIQAGCTIYRTAKSPSPHHKVSSNFSKHFFNLMLIGMFNSGGFKLQHGMTKTDTTENGLPDSISVCRMSGSLC